MKHAGGGFDYSYNAQAAVDDTAHIIVAAELSNSAADSVQLPTVLAAVLRDAGADPRQVLADAGYRSEATFEQLREHPVDLIVALGREGKKDVKIDATKRPLCAAMAEKFASLETQSAYRKRKWLSEPPNAWVKSVLGFRQFSMRGLAKAQAEWKLVCAALNLRRMAKMTFA
jgi:IS5 family transposase